MSEDENATREQGHHLFHVQMHLALKTTRPAKQKGKEAEKIFSSSDGIKSFSTQCPFAIKFMAQQRNPLQKTSIPSGYAILF
jgi:hypothetical protein